MQKYLIFSWLMIIIVGIVEILKCSKRGKKIGIIFNSILLGIAIVVPIGMYIGYSSNPYQFVKSCNGTNLFHIDDYNESIDVFNDSIKIYNKNLEDYNLSIMFGSEELFTNISSNEKSRFINQDGGSLNVTGNATVLYPTAISETTDSELVSLYKINDYDNYYIAIRSNEKKLQNGDKISYVGMLIRQNDKFIVIPSIINGEPLTYTNSNNSANIQEDTITESTINSTSNKKNEDIYSQFNGTIWGTVLNDYIEYECYNDFNDINVDEEIYKTEICDGVNDTDLMLSPIIYEGQHITTTAELKEIQEVYSDEDDNIKILRFIFYDEESVDLYVLCHNFNFTDDFLYNYTYYSIYGVCHFTYYEDYVVPYINCYYIEGMS